MTNLPPRPQDLPIWSGNEIVPRFVYEDYPNAVNDAVSFFRSLFFWKEWDKNPGNEEVVKDVVERVAMSKMYSLIQTGTLRSNMEDALLFQLHDAQVNQWPQEIGDGIAEIGTMAELIGIALQKEKEKRPDGGMYYEYRKFLQMLQVLEKTAMQAAKKGGLVGEKAKERVSKQVMTMITTPNISSKIRESGSVVEHILLSSADEVTKVKLVEEVFDDVLNDEVVFLSFREKNRKRMGKAGKTVLDPVPGDVYLLGSQEIIVIESRSQSQTRAIESKLSGMVTSLTPKAGTEMIKRLESLVKFKGTHEEYLYDTDSGFYAHPDGFRMPTPETYYRMAQETVLQSREVINQYVAVTDEPLWMMIERLSSGVNESDVLEYMCQIFHANMQDTPNMVKSITRIYKLPPDLHMLWPKRSVTTHLRAQNNEFGLFVRIGK